MAKLTQTEQKQIQTLAKDERWDALIKFVELKLEQWRGEEVAGPSAFEELRAMHKRDGKIAGVLELFEQIEKKAYDN